MRTIFAAGIAGLFLAISATGAASQTILFRPALDAVGNAEPPASESAQIPDDIGFGAAAERSAPRPRGRVIIESGVAAPVNSHARRRRQWQIER
jgi:hypothetical protein